MMGAERYPRTAAAMLRDALQYCERQSETAATAATAALMTHGPADRGYLTQHGESLGLAAAVGYLRGCVALAERNERAETAARLARMAEQSAQSEPAEYVEQF